MIIIPQVADDTGNAIQRSRPPAKISDNAAIPGSQRSGISDIYDKNILVFACTWTTITFLFLNILP